MCQPPEAPECPVCGLPELVLEEGLGGTELEGTENEYAPHPDCEQLQQVEAYLPMETHHYHVSTACLHEVHGTCSVHCQFCRAPCLCPCHGEVELTVELPWPLK